MLPALSRATFSHTRVLILRAQGLCFTLQLLAHWLFGAVYLSFINPFRGDRGFQVSKERKADLC